MTFFSGAIDRLVDRLQEPASHATLIFVAFYTFLWGLWLLVFDVFSRAPLYMVLNGIAPEDNFGALALMTGTFMATSVLYDRYPWTAYGALVGTVFWILIAWAYFLGDYHNTGGLTASGVAAYSAFMYLNIRLNQKSRHDLHFE